MKLTKFYCVLLCALFMSSTAHAASTGWLSDSAAAKFQKNNRSKVFMTGIECKDGSGSNFRGSNGMQVKISYKNGGGRNSAAYWGRANTIKNASQRRFKGWKRKSYRTFRRTQSKLLMACAIYQK